MQTCFRPGFLFTLFLGPPSSGAENGAGDETSRCKDTMRALKPSPWGRRQLQEFLCELEHAYAVCELLCELEHVCAVCELSLKPAMVEPGIPIIYDFRGLGELHQLSVPLFLFHLPKGDNLHPG